MTQPADLIIINGRWVTGQPEDQHTSAIGVRDGRIVAVGDSAALRSLIGRRTEVVDATGGVIVPAFHDAHIHLLSYARATSRLRLDQVTTVSGLSRDLAERARSESRGRWIRAVGYDEDRLCGPLLDRHMLDRAVPDHPVRVQHRGQHLDVFNTQGLRAIRLFDIDLPQIERDTASHEPTGRLYDAADLLRGRMPRPDAADLGRSVRQACRRLLSWGVTSVQDASVTNGADEWIAFQGLHASGDLLVRMFMMSGAQHWQELDQLSASDSAVRKGPVKLMLDEKTTDPYEARAIVAAVHAAGRSVALHAVSEAEVALAVDALRSNPRVVAVVPDRIEHGATIPDPLLADVRALGAAVVGQPSLVYDRGDRYLADHPADQWGWLHRAASLVRTGVLYAAGSDAPLTEPNPRLGLHTLLRRRTRNGYTFGFNEALTPLQALAAYTLFPARVVGAAHELGRLRVGAVADLVILDPDTLEATGDYPDRPEVRATIKDGRAVWRRADTDRMEVDKTQYSA